MKATFAEKKAQAKEAVEKMQAKLAEGILSDADWTKHLRFMSKMHNYSPRNSLLMWFQWEERKIARQVVRSMETMFFGGPISETLPEMSYPAGFSTWQGMAEDDAQVVRKGEKALAVLAPVTVNDKKDIDPATGKPKKKLIGFVLKNRTFDFSQTVGIDAPPALVKLLEGAGPEDVWTALVKLAEANGYTVNIGSTDRPGVNGYIAWLTKEIRISDKNDRAQQVKTLAHEIGHMLLHEPSIAPVSMPQNVMEIEAESVAYSVLDMVGFDSSDYSFGYVASWSKGNGTLIASTMERVTMTASRIVTFLETGELPAAKAAAKFDFTEAEAATEAAA